ncbi:hypothetical protein KIY77_gp68 [Mycobacterium phage Mundrea]|uniref:Uncharacterized protein n=1 Tax=Mycobacterium phage Mundrea TaxID=1897540 RepID=A0A1C9LYN1_9CAUD|nr:hypothetical protein KIY77_gp68 [Mycobacterium phage Mundrea]AOQ27995.1 hypothetical protein SEA_MUNDREA_68 [Mycobacterium phage Mundrea]
MTLFFPLVVPVPPPAALPPEPPAVVRNVAAPAPGSDRPEPIRISPKVATRVGRNSPLSLSIKRPGFLFAQTHNDPNGKVGLTVYRSVAVRDSDPAYQPVIDMIAENDFHLAYTAEVTDTAMMFGKAEDSYYVTVEKT